MQHPDSSDSWQDSASPNLSTWSFCQCLLVSLQLFCTELWLTLSPRSQPSGSQSCVYQEMPPEAQVLPLFPQVSWELLHRYPAGSFLGDFTVSFCPPTQECPCVLTALLLQELGVASTAPRTYPGLLEDEGQTLGPGDELAPGQMLQTVCGNW